MTYSNSQLEQLMTNKEYKTLYYIIYMQRIQMSKKRFYQVGL